MKRRGGLTMWIQERIKVWQRRPWVACAVALHLAALTLSCGDELVSSAVEVRPGQEVEWRVVEGKDFVLLPENVVVAFRRVVEDSRCPADVVCVWEGRAQIRLEVVRPAGESYTSLLTIPGLVETPYRGGTVEIDGYAFRLLQLDPYPKFSERDRPRPYEALLGIERL
jgi:hypothetical protein